MNKIWCVECYSPVRGEWCIVTYPGESYYATKAKAEKFVRKESPNYPAAKFRVTEFVSKRSILCNAKDKQ